MGLLLRVALSPGYRSLRRGGAVASCQSECLAIRCLHRRLGADSGDLDVGPARDSAALGCAGILVEAMARRLLGERVAEYQGYESLKYGLDTTRLTRPAVLICLTLSAVIAFLLMDYYVLVDRRGVTVDRLFALGERVYGYDDVVGVETWTRRFDTKSEARMQVFFRDGTSWESRWSPRDLRDEDVRALSALIAMRAGVRVREVFRRE